MKNILFRADSSSTIGTGHIMRDLVLASHYKDSNIIFATQELDGNINEKIEEAGYKVEILKSNSLKKVIQLVKKYNIDLVVIDHYGIDYKYEKELKKQTGVKILSFDDTYEKHYCDILLNHNISADEKRYNNLVPDSCEVRCGSKYTLLRDEFKKEKNKKQKKHNAENKTIFLAMGGADHSNINIEILNVLQMFDNLKVNLVTTTANKNLKELKKYVKNREWIKLRVNSNKIAKLMRESDFAIISPSVSANEAYFMGTPFISIKTAENQDDMYRYLKKKKFLVLEKFKEEKLKKYLKILLNGISLINFTDLTLEEKKMILSWRNNTSVKQWMYNSDEISLGNHLNFIENLKSCADKLYFLVKQGNDYIGVIDFTNIDKDGKSSEFGLYANIELKGMGKILLDAICEYGFNTLQLNKLMAEAFVKNEKAINLYKRFNFKESMKKRVNDREVICMELNNEDR